MDSGEFTYSTTEVARYSRSKHRCNRMWKCSGTISRNVCYMRWVIWLRR